MYSDFINAILNCNAPHLVYTEGASRHVLCVCAAVVLTVINYHPTPPPPPSPPPPSTLLYQQLLLVNNAKSCHVMSVC